MNARRLLLAALVAAMLLPWAAADAARGGAPHADGSSSSRAMPDLGRVNARSLGTPGKITGFDGLDYESSPFVVHGLDGQLFLGPDFDSACGLGPRYVRALRTLAKVAAIIEKSGRRAIFTAAPNKSTVLPGELDPAQLPHGACDTRGIAAQTKVLDTFPDRNYLPLRAALARSRHQTYWKTDPHWTSVGGTVFAQQVARRLSKKLAKRQHYAYGTDTGLGMLNADLGDQTTETIETALPDNGVKVKTAPGCAEWAGYPTLIYETCWNSAPAKKTWPGQTLLLGDSFMMYGLQSLRPLFHHGRWMWLGHSDHDVAKAIKDSDTVVIEVLQIFVPGTIIAQKSLRKELRRILL